MNIQIRTNTTPIHPGDDVTIAFLPDAQDLALTIRYSVHLSVNSGGAFRRTLAADVSPLAGGEWEWSNIDVVGSTLVIRVTSHRIDGSRRNARSGVFSVVPLPPVVTDPIEEQTLSMGGSWTVRWEQPPPEPDADSYAISYQPNPDATFQILKDGISGSARSASVTIPGPVTDDGVLRVEGQYSQFTPRRDNVAVNVTDRPVVVVKRPTRASVWFLGDEATVTWVASSAPGAITGFSVQLSRNNGSTWTTVASDLPATQRQLVLGVDPPSGTQSKIRVIAHWSGGDVSAQSPTFRIRVNPVDP